MVEALGSIRFTLPAFPLISCCHVLIASHVWSATLQEGRCETTLEPDTTACGTSSQTAGLDPLCQRYQCHSGTCVLNTTPNNAPCGSAGPCTFTPRCQSNVCTASLRANGTQCDDGNTATVLDTCTSGTCAGIISGTCARAVVGFSHKIFAVKLSYPYSL